MIFLVHSLDRILKYPEVKSHRLSLTPIVQCGVYIGQGLLLFLFVCPFFLVCFLE